MLALHGEQALGRVSGRQDLQEARRRLVLEERRRSGAFFHDGNVEAVIETLPTCLDADGTSAYAPITVGEHIRAKLAGSRAGVANPEAEREAARVLAARPA